MSLELLAPLAALALVDSTSFGTLLIPLWLMLAPGRFRPQRVLLFLGVVGGYYLALGLALLAGATQLADALAGFLASPVAAWGQLALGVGLFVLSFRIAPKKPDQEQTQEQTQRAHESAQGSAGVADAGASAAVAGTGASSGAGSRPEGTGGTQGAQRTSSGTPAQPGRLSRWRAKAMGGAGSTGALVGLALGAAALETASMIPYLGAIGLLTASDLTWAAAVPVLAGYCLLMIAPALVALVLRLAVARRVEPVLQRLEAWLTNHAASTTSWVVGILGFLLARDALTRTDVLSQLLG